MKRREFIKKTGQAIALAAVAGEVGLLSSSCREESPRKTTTTKPNFEVENDPQLPRIVHARNIDNALALSTALVAIGGIGRFVKKGEKVLLKPNLAWDRTPQQAANTRRNRPYRSGRPAGFGGDGLPQGGIPGDCLRPAVRPTPRNQKQNSPQ